MRIRKRGNPHTSESSGAQQRPGGVGGSSHQQEQLGVSSLPVVEEANNASIDEGEHGMRGSTGEDDPLRRTGVSVNASIHERAGVGGKMTFRAPPTLVVDLLQSGRAASNPSETYMNLDEFVDSLARENCFPADDSTSHHPRGSSLMSMLHNGDLHFERSAGGSLHASPPPLSTHAELDTSLRLGQASHPIMAPTQERGKSRVDSQTEFESSSESDGSENLNLSPQSRLKSRDNPRAGCNAGTSGDAGTSRDPELERRNEKNAPRPSHVEMFDESDMAQRPVSAIEAVRRELASSPSDHLTRKSSTGSMEPAGFGRKRRVSEEPASSKRRRISSPAPTTTEELLAADHPAKQSKGSLMFSLYTVYHDAGREGLTAGEAISTVTQQALPGFEESECRSRRHVTKLLRNSPYFMELGEGKFALCSAMIDAEEDDPDPDPDHDPDASEEAGGSDSSNRSGGASTLPVSSSSLAMTDSEKRKQEVELERKVRESGGGGGGTTAAAGVASSQQTERKPSGRSGRPKRLKYLKQDNVEELGNQCNRSDGKGWTCPLLAKTGYQLCDHHLDKLRCKPGSRSKYKKKKKKKHS